MASTETFPNGITFQRERAQDLFAEAKPMLEAHWAEIAHYPDIPLDPDFEAYVAAEDAGFIRVFTLRDKGELKGYSAFFVRAAMHYRGSKQAVNDILYLDPALRRHMLGARFIQFCHVQLRTEGCQVSRLHVKLAHDFGPLLQRLGGEAEETIWTFRLDRRA